MKIEKINENQIRCTLNKYDLASREIKLSELAYGSDKAKRLFKDMMQQASAEVGFEAEDIPLMIEAIPISSDCIVLMITKVEDPEELDTRFSRFAPMGDDMDTEPSPMGIDMDAIWKAASEYIEKFDEASKGDSPENSKGFVPLPETVREKIDVQKKSPAAKHNIPGISSPITTIFSFDALDDVISLAASVRGNYNGTNSLYKCEKDGRYYLVISQDSMSQEKFAVVCNLLSEYGKMERYNYASKSYYEEQFTKLIGKRALQKLSTVSIL